MAGVVEFVLRARDEATKEIQKVSGELGGLSKLSGTLFSGMGAATAAVAGLTAAAAGVYTLSKAIADSAETLDRQAKSAGTTTENMQAMKLAFENAGLSGDDASKALGFLAQNIAVGNPLLEELGIKTKDAYSAFLQLADIFSRSSDANKMAYITGELLGKSMRDNSGIVGELGTAARETVGDVNRLGGAMNAAAMKDALQLDKQMDALNKTLNLSKTALGIQVTPALIEATKATSGLVTVLSRALPLFTDLQKASLLGLSASPLGMIVAVNALTGRVLKGSETRPEMMSAHGPGSSADPLGKVNVGPPPSGSGGGAPAPRRPMGPTWLGPSTTDVSIADVRAFGASADPYLSKAGASLRGVSPSAKAIEDMLKTLEMVREPALMAGDAMQIAAAKMAAGGITIRAMQQAVASDISSAVNSVVSGTATIGQAFTGMVESILQDIAAKAAEYGIGMFLMTFGGPLAPVGAAMVGASGLSTTPAPGGGGNTYNIQSIDTKSVLQSLTSPTGSMRRANDRIRDVRMAR